MSSYHGDVIVATIPRKTQKTVDNYLTLPQTYFYIILSRNTIEAFLASQGIGLLPRDFDICSSAPVSSGDCFVQLDCCTSGGIW